MNPTYTIILTNCSYSDDIRYSEVFDRVPTRQDVEDEFVTISSGDHPSRTYGHFLRWGRSGWDHVYGIRVR